MRKKIVIFGDSLFQYIRIEKGNIVVTNHTATIKLNQNFDIDNYSINNLDSSRALRLVKSLVKENQYNDCILALGENDLDNIDLFRQNMIDIVSYLNDCKIKPVLFGLPKMLLNNPKAIEIEKVIEELANTINNPYQQKETFSCLEEYEIVNRVINLC